MAAKRKPKPPILGGVAEVAERLYITKSALADRRRNHDFPKPLAELACGPVWGSVRHRSLRSPTRRGPSHRPPLAQPARSPLL